MIPAAVSQFVKNVEQVNSEGLPKIKETPNTEIRELPENIENRETVLIVEQPDISFIESTSRTALMEQSRLNFSESRSEVNEITTEGLTEAEKTKIKEETGWSDEIIENIKNMEQYEILKEAGLVETEIDGRKCLVRENIDLNYTDEDGVTNRERMARGLPPLDSKTGKPIELHHLGQKANSPLVELTAEEHRTGEYEDGKKNQSLWHDNTIETEVHGEGNRWTSERRDHWTARAEKL